MKVMLYGPEAPSYTREMPLLIDCDVRFGGM
jgi:hypothetical protein